MRIVDLLERDALLFEAKTALLVADELAHAVESVTFEALRNRVLRLAAGLQSCGVRSGNRIALMADNGLLHFDIYLAACYLGAAAVPLSTRWTDAELTTILSDAEPTISVADNKHISKLKQAKTVTNSGLLISTDEPAYADLLAYEPLDDLNRSQADDTALIMYTSGTTSQPKGVCLSQGALAFNGLTMALVQRFQPDDVFLSTTPMYHTAAGSRVCSMLADAQTHVVLRHFSAEAFFAAVAQYQVSIALLVPTQLRRILDHPNLAQANLSSLRLITYGAASTPSTLIREAQERLGCNLYQAYGITECVSNLTGLMPQDHKLALSERPELLKSCGRAVPGVRIQVRDAQGREVPSAEVGEVWARTPKAMSGYWRNPGLTQKTMVDGWLRTGDLGHLDSEGYLYITGRVTEMLISGGVNIHPSQIEAVICDHPKVTDAAVVGRANSEWGERPVAFVELCADSSCDSSSEQMLNDTTEELRSWCSGRLAKPQVPDEFIIMDNLPRTSAGKVQKASLKEHLVQP
ncbi:MAG: acyl--CoA ligase [Acidimicrobiia bacterium]|nr:acyl--CoA ligase [Acidimicrobiia bacterium]